MNPSRGLIQTTISAIISTACILALVSCGNSTDPLPASSTPGGSSGASGSTTAALLTLSASPTSVPSDNSASSTVTVTAVSAANAALPGITVNLATDTGVVSAASVTTGSAGTATFTFSSGVGNLANRTATVTAAAGTTTAQIPIQISGSTLAVFSGGGQTIPDNGTSPASVTFIARNAQGTAVANAAITVVASGTGVVTLNPASGVTDSAGKFTTSVAGVTGGVGTATITATGVGSTAAATVNVTLSATTFAISQTQLNTAAPVLSPTSVAMSIGDQLTVTVAAPAGTTAVTFATSIGTWVGGTNILANVPVAGGTASATLTTLSAGVASVQALDPATPSLNDSLTVSMTAVTPNAVTLQATPSVVPKSIGTTTGNSTLIATVLDVNGQPVGNAPVAFSIVNPTGGGETVSPVIAYTAATAGGGLTLGQALASFTSGSLTSGASGVQIHATVLGTTVQTEPAGVNLTASGNDASVVIGGTAGSVAFGSATVLTVNSNATAYIQAMSVLVADANGTPAPKGTVVNLSLWPIAWSTGAGCAFDGDEPSGTAGTFLNEDANENLILDTGEDGVRKYYASGTTMTTATICTLTAGGTWSCTSSGTANSSAGTLDSMLTPANSTAGTLASANAADAPGTVTTDSSGVGMFNLTYGKNSAIWTVVRIRASTMVAGSAAVGELQFRLAPLASDITPVCRLPDSPYKF
jgi:hypothetical protein